MSRGYVYVLTNEYMPGLVKIGMTRGEPEVRAKQLSATGIPADFEVYGSVYTFDPAYLEAIVHEAFGDQRVASGREFFKINPVDAIRKIEEMHEEIIEGVVFEFLETHCLVERSFAVDPSVFLKKAHELGVHPYEMPCIIEELEAEDMLPALAKYREKQERRKANGRDLQ